MPDLWQTLDELDGDLLEETDREAEDFYNEVKYAVAQRSKRVPVSTADTSFEAGPSRYYSTTPRIDSPIDLTVVLPPPPPSPIAVARPLPELADTQEVPSPRETPSNRIGEGRRDDPATPLPLGVATFTRLRSRKDFQTVSKHFEAFEKGISKELKRTDSKGKGKEVESALTGCRICMPPETGGASKLKQRWDIVSLSL